MRWNLGLVLENQARRLSECLPARIHVFHNCIFDIFGCESVVDGLGNDIKRIFAIRYYGHHPANRNCYQGEWDNDNMAQILKHQKEEQDLHIINLLTNKANYIHIHVGRLV